MSLIAEWVLWLSPTGLITALCLINGMLLFYRARRHLVCVEGHTLYWLALSMMIYAVSYHIVTVAENPFTNEIRAVFRLAFVVVLVAITSANVSAVYPAIEVNKWKKRRPHWRQLLDHWRS